MRSNDVRWGQTMSDEVKRCQIKSNMIRWVRVRSEEDEDGWGQIRYIEVMVTKIPQGHLRSARSARSLKVCIIFLILGVASATNVVFLPVAHPLCTDEPPLPRLQPGRPHAVTVLLQNQHQPDQLSQVQVCIKQSSGFIWLSWCNPH